VPGTEWRIVVKQDVAEAFAAVSYMAVLVVGAIALFIVTAAYVSLLFWGRQSAVLELRASRAEMERLALEGRFDYLSRYANDAILLADDGLVVKEANDSALALYGYRREELIGKNLRDLATEAPPFLQEGLGLGAAANDGGYRFETEQLRKDGSPVWVEVSARVFAVDGRRFVQEIVRDITEAKQSRESIIASMKEKEVLLKELHHRTKNNMQVITSLLILQAEELESPELQRSFMEMVGKIRSMRWSTKSSISRRTCPASTSAPTSGNSPS
jgi:PAS domain S-box-containing protein